MADPVVGTIRRPPAERELRQELLLHLNMGRGAGAATYRITADGEDTGMRYSYESKRGRYVLRHLWRPRPGQEDETLDLLNAQGVDPMAWIRERLAP